MKSLYLGIDVGSVAISMAAIDTQAHITKTFYDFHKGQIEEKVIEFLNDLDLSELKAIGYTSSTPPIIKNGLKVDSTVAYISSLKHFHPQIPGLLIIGAEKFGLATFFEDGEYKNFKSNSSCAAGTGNFLDQQAERLNLKNIQEFSTIAYQNKGSYPKIASRCAVFAKTDLIHAQQEGYSLAEICDGLSYGLAKNIVDSVLHFNNTPKDLVAAGGVALNKAVISHIEKLTKSTITTDKHAHIYGAVGAALNCLESEQKDFSVINSISNIIIPGNNEKRYSYPPLQLKLSDYPDFDAHEKYEFQSKRFPGSKTIEVDIYSEFNKKTPQKVFLGIDIGSTSTKAVIMDENKLIMYGFYTRTSGQPIIAVQSILECISNLEEKFRVKFNIIGTGTTGSGRKFTGKIIGADIVLDEITAHARAAYELNPETDTIIEIGGQDSKFTVMKDGMVTFSVMNNVCAAGTGSFIEEQAKRLNCSLKEYADRAENVHSPMASDRCTVFMERDLNQYIRKGYSTNEILAAVLHSTRENYLSKVASKGVIGNKIYFQGATAKNRALVAAFEQKLNKPIMVSRYCHLTGALGVALELYDIQCKTSKFRGLKLWKKHIPVKSEVCELCTNHCKLKVAKINNVHEAYGFLCGRDYNTKSYIKTTDHNFNLINKYQEIFNPKVSVKKNQPIIGIPAGLHLHEEINFWKKFFDLLNLNVISSEKYSDAILIGKNISNAEFCSPMAAMHGHINFLKDKADYIFLPVYLKESAGTNLNQQYCYYTQFVSSVISVHSEFKQENKILSPLLKFSQNVLSIKLELFHMFKTLGLNAISFAKISEAFETAIAFDNAAKKCWKSIYQTEIQQLDDIHIMLLGRPYTVLSPIMNSSIPELIEKQGVKAFYMNMRPESKIDISSSDELTKTLKWKFGSKILDATEKIVNTKNCYPVLITSFKCTPDSFIIEYFKEICNANQKPYLILQLDEHDSSVGYETRIESGIRAFRNHQLRQKNISKFTPPDQDVSENIPNSAKLTNGNSWNNYIQSLINETSQVLKTHSIDFRLFGNKIQEIKTFEHNYSGEILKNPTTLQNKTLLLPAWDNCVGPLLEAVLRNSGIDTRLVTNSDSSIQHSLSHNTGQCLPLNIIVQNAIDYIESENLNPTNTALWIMKTKLSCNLPMFPFYMKKLLEEYGQGLDKSSIYVGDIIFYDFSLKTAINAYLAYMFGGYIRKLGCSFRPYEKVKGTTDEVINNALINMYEVFFSGKSKEEALRETIHEFESIDVHRVNKPKVAIFGDLYVRDNDLFNQNLVKTIEENGGEVITTPFSEYMKIVVDPHTERSLKERNYSDYVKIMFLKSLIPLVESRYLKELKHIFGEFEYPTTKETTKWLDNFGLNILHRGESLENILKIQMLLKQHPDIDLFIQTNPSYCCPSLVTEAMTTRIEELTGVPVLTIEYDGTLGLKNENVIPYLKYRKKRKENSAII